MNAYFRKYKVYFHQLKPLDIYFVATCVLPPVSNGEFGGDCSEGQTLFLGKVCPLVCDTNYQESVASVECIDAGNLDAIPTCTGAF